MSSAVAVVHKLEAAGFDRKQAEAQVEAVAELVAADSATKNDVAAIDRKIDALRTDIDHKIDALRTDIDHKIDALRSEIRSDMEILKRDLTIRLGSMMVVAVGAVAAMVKLL